MNDRKYGNVLTIILVIGIIIVLALISKLLYDVWDKKRIKSAAEEAIAEFNKPINIADTNSNNDIDSINTTQIKVSADGLTYGGYNMMGYIEIPTIKVKYPVLERVTTHSIEIAVAILQGAGVNEVGNTVIVGHNYRNGLFFSDLNKLKVNDVIYLTDRSKERVKYKVYNVFSTTPEDTSFYDRKTDGKKEITLETCSDTVTMRTVVLAKEVTEEENKAQNMITNQITSAGGTIVQ